MDAAAPKPKSRAKLWRENLLADPARTADYRQKTRAASKARYNALKSDPEFLAKERQRKRELKRKLYADPKSKAVILKQAATYRAKPEYKARQAESMAAWKSANRDAVRAYQTHWIKENAEHVREYAKEFSKEYRARPEVKQFTRAKQLSNYGLTMAAFVAMWESQSGKCAVCSIEMLPTGRYKDSVCVDHNHVTGDVRGLLCQGCNHGIGNLKDSPEVLEQAAAYLRSRGHYSKHKTGN